MKYPKVTRSKDDVRRMTVKIEHRVSKEDLIIAFGDIIEYDINVNLFEHNINFYEDELLNKITKADIFKRLRYLLEVKGESMGYCPEGWSFEETLMKFATKHIDKYFPDF